MNHENGEAMRALGVPCDVQGPVFAEPWQGQLFAMTLMLHEQGLFSWSEWAQFLSQAIQEAQSQGDPDLGNTYYSHWCAALENMLRVKAVAAPLALASLRQAWKVAAESTPHGEPIRLRRSMRQG